MPYILFLAISLSLTNSLFAAQVLTLTDLQKTHKPISLDSTAKTLLSPPILDIPAIDTAKVKTLTETLSKTYQFAVPYEKKTSYTNDGMWTTIGDSAVWRLEVQALGSQSLNFGFKDIFLPSGAKLFVYASDRSEAVVFTEKDNKPHREIWTPVFENENVIIEINVPVELKNYLLFDLAKINQGYRSIKSSAIAKSGSCNIDVVCPSGDEWRDDIRSVARITINGSGLCSGTLVNNTNLDGTPYFLTAAHCGINAGNAASVIAYWNYETSTCGGAANGSLLDFQTGSTFRAGWGNGNIGEIGSDFTLIELDSVPSVSANVSYAGWNNSISAPNGVVGIHHPSGDEKSISFDNDLLTITNFGENVSTSNANFLRVAAWDGGTTEQGSSGSGIWNSNHHLIGTLSGGIASCSGLVDNNQPDWYGRFTKHWTGGGTSNTRLSNWLDPATSGTATSLESSSMNCNRPSATISISSNPGMINESILFSAVASGGSGGYTYQWDFNNDGSIDSTEANTHFTYTSSYQGIISVNITDSAACTKSLVRAMIVNNSTNSNNTIINNNSGGGGNTSFLFLNFILLLLFRKRFL